MLTDVGDDATDMDGKGLMAVNARSGKRSGRTRLVPVLLAAVVAVSTGCSAPDRAPAQHGAAPTASRTSAANALPRTYLAECVEDELTERPMSYTLSCADGNASLDELTWQGWGTDTATAKGVVVSNSCDPDCATGKLRRDPAKVSAAGLRRRGSVQLYTKLTVTYTDTVPEGAFRVETWEVPY